MWFSVVDHSPFSLAFCPNGPGAKVRCTVFIHKCPQTLPVANKEESESNMWLTSEKVVLL